MRRLHAPARHTAAKGGNIVVAQIIRQNQDDVGRALSGRCNGFPRPLRPGYFAVRSDHRLALTAELDQRQHDINALIPGQRTEARHHQQRDQENFFHAPCSSHLPIAATVSMLSCPARPALRCTEIARISSDCIMLSIASREGYTAIATVSQRSSTSPSISRSTSAEKAA